MASIEPEIIPASTSVSNSLAPQNTNTPEEKVATPMQSDSDDKPVPPSRTGSPRPLRIYTRAQLIALYNSPLVCLPNGMPELKDWFGVENEQNLSKKESEPTTPNSGRERRFRRDEDGELPSRPSFRSSPSQPSQMGNFRHQSLRSSDRDGDKEGQERLRNLSDKYDRDRLGLSASGLRSKERDVAPHLAGSSRLPAQTPGIAARRAETREGNKKKIGETTSEDWRRDSRRSDRSENARADREERPRSRIRDSSRHRREPSTSRREDGRRERDREREEYRKDRDREEQRRGERENGDDDDPRRWRDDGRRDERMVARRERERNRDKASEGAWDSPGDRRWTVVEERDGRNKRGVGKDKKSSVIDDKGDERRGDREREKEPAWMDTYIPTTGSGGILGGKGNDGELDGIQAWKKSVKEKEQKANKVTAVPNDDPPRIPDIPQKASEGPLDEIQRFKKMMELAQKTPNGTSENSAPIVGPVIGSQESKVDPAIVGTKGEPSVSTDPSRSLLSLLSSSEPSRSVQSTSTLESSPKSPNPSDIEYKSTTEATSQFTPPQGSRLLALGRSSGRPSPLNNQSLVTPVLNGPLSSTSAQPTDNGFPNVPTPQSDHVKLNPRASSGFSPFEEQHNGPSRRASGDRSPFSAAEGSWPDSAQQDPLTAGQAMGRGSRFAKFFDSKGKDVPTSAPGAQKPAGPPGLISSSPIPSGRLEGNIGGGVAGPGHEHRTVEDLFAKLSMNSLPGQRSTQVPNSAPISNASFGQHAQNHLQQQIHSPGHLAANNRVEPLYESRNFMPDGLVPGLRSAPPPRRADGGPGMYSDPLDDAIMLNSQQRLALQQQRNVDQLYSGAMPTGYTQQGSRNVGNIPLQQQHFRGGPSPVSNHQGSLHNVQQRLPPGLANLGGRPPHDPSQQYVGIQGLNSQGLHGLHVNGPPQAQQFNNFSPGGNPGFNGPHAQLRGGPSAHQIPNSLTQQQLGNLNHASNLDARGGNQAQFLALNGLNGLGGGMRNVGGAGFNPQQNSAQMQNPLLAMRQQQQQQQPQMLPHVMQHLGPVHLQQQGPPLPSQPTTTQDLMALLLGGTHRE